MAGGDGAATPVSGPAVRAAAEWTRQTPPALAAAITEAGIYRMYLPRSMGVWKRPRIMPVPLGGVSWHEGIMDRLDILARLRENEAALRARGVAHAALLGSRARGDARPDSDTDILIEIDPAARIGVYEYVGLKEYIASLFDGPVDVVNREGLKPYVRPAVTADVIYAF